MITLKELKGRMEWVLLIVAGLLLGNSLKSFLIKTFELNQTGWLGEFAVGISILVIALMLFDVEN